MSFFDAQTHEILAHDIDPDFIKTASMCLAWEYDRLFEELHADTSLSIGLKLEEFGRRRGSCAVKALVRSCEKHGVPFNFRHLECNGQSKLLVKVGRVVLIQEPILELSEEPRASDYKRVLASTYGIVRQLELNLGDQPWQILDWSGNVLAVLLHGASGRCFSR